MIRLLLQRGLLAIGLAFLIFTVTSSAIELDPVSDVGMTVVVIPKSVPSGGSGNLIVRIALPEHTHITSVDYGFFFIEPDETEGIEWGNVVFPTGVEYEVENVFQGNVELTVPFTATVSDRTETIDIAGTVGYQICTESAPIYCTPPVERRFTASFIIEPQRSTDAIATETIPPSSTPEVPNETSVQQVDQTVGDSDEVTVPVDTVETVIVPQQSSTDNQPLSIEARAIKALEEGSILALLWIFIAGMLLSLTPCVYPVIPITIAFIGARSEGNRWKGFSLSLVFVLGLGLVYSTLGVIAAATGGVFGLSTQNPWVIGFVTVLFLVMGIGMLGAFDISLPSSVQTKLSGKQRSGYVGALLVGGATGLIAAPCVGPVLIALLGWVSSTGNLFLGFLYLFVFAAGLGVLFVVIGTFAGAMAGLPQAGGWMEKIKQAFGILLIAVALYFCKPLISPDLFTLLVGLALLLLSGFWGGFSRLESDAEMGRKIGRGFAFFVALVGAYYVLLGLMRLEGINFTAPPTGDVQVEHISGINWIYDDEDTA
ncbi:MAG: cytochrome c biogenesis protein CcdA, partial [Candidatus Electryoneaceae bacterium]|nr:cytochrome c biogenesis protein CcdA [Candidatus Electryoneaceae bacterium]